MSARILAAAVLALEALGVLALVVWQILALTAGDTAFLASALALVVLTVVSAVGIMVFSVATARGLSWGRSGGIVVQVLIIAVALGAVTGSGAAPLTAAAIALPGVVGLVVLLLAVKQSAPPRTPDES